MAFLVSVVSQAMYIFISLGNFIFSPTNNLVIFFLVLLGGDLVPYPIDFDGVNFNPRSHVGSDAS